MLDPEKIEAKIPAFAKAMEERHAPNDWKLLLYRTADLMLALGERNLLEVEVFQKISHPALVCLGDSDQMITREETAQAATALPNGSLHIFENTPHPFEKMDVLALSAAVNSFLKSDKG